MFSWRCRYFSFYLIGADEKGSRCFCWFFMGFFFGRAEDCVGGFCCGFIFNFVIVLG